MSTKEYSDQEKISKKALHRRHDSGELHVFEAARYFSGGNEVSGNKSSSCTQKIMPMRNLLPSQTHVMDEKMKEKKNKQPSSPGGKLASFLNSLFHQTPSKKKKSKSITNSMKDEDDSSGWRRKRRSSISHFRSLNTIDSKSIYSSSSSGFRTPPSSHTPTKTYKDLRSYSDHKEVVTLAKHNGNLSSDYAWLDEKFKFSNGISEKYMNFGDGFSGKGRTWADQYLCQKFKKFNTEVDDGEDSDSSSDLFELQNYDLSDYSSGLPVYETTHMDSIKGGAPISNGPI